MLKKNCKFLCVLKLSKIQQVNPYLPLIHSSIQPPSVIFRVITGPGPPCGWPQPLMQRRDKRRSPTEAQLTAN